MNGLGIAVMVGALFAAYGLLVLWDAVSGGRARRRP